MLDIPALPQCLPRLFRAPAPRRSSQVSQYAGTAAERTTNRTEGARVRTTKGNSGTVELSVQQTVPVRRRNRNTTNYDCASGPKASFLNIIE